MAPVGAHPNGALDASRAFSSRGDWKLFRGGKRWLTRRKKVEEGSPEGRAGGPDYHPRGAHPYLPLLRRQKAPEVLFWGLGDLSSRSSVDARRAASVDDHHRISMWFASAMRGGLPAKGSRSTGGKREGLCGRARQIRSFTAQAELREAGGAEVEADVRLGKRRGSPAGMLRSLRWRVAEPAGTGLHHEEVGLVEAFKGRGSADGSDRHQAGGGGILINGADSRPRSTSSICRGSPTTVSRRPAYSAAAQRAD